MKLLQSRCRHRAREANSLALLNSLTKPLTHLVSTRAIRQGPGLLLEHLGDILFEHAIPAGGLDDDLVHELAFDAAELVAEVHALDGGGEVDTAEEVVDGVLADLVV